MKNSDFDRNLSTLPPSKVLRLDAIRRQSTKQKLSLSFDLNHLKSHQRSIESKSAGMTKLCRHKFNNRGKLTSNITIGKLREQDISICPPLGFLSNCLKNNNRVAQTDQNLNRKDNNGVEKDRKIPPFQCEVHMEIVDRSNKKQSLNSTQYPDVAISERLTLLHNDNKRQSPRVPASTEHGGDWYKYNTLSNSKDKKHNMNCYEKSNNICQVTCQKIKQRKDEILYIDSVRLPHNKMYPFTKDLSSANVIRAVQLHSQERVQAQLETCKKNQNKSKGSYLLFPAFKRPTFIQTDYPLESYFQNREKQQSSDKTNYDMSAFKKIPHNPQKPKFSTFFQLNIQQSSMKTKQMNINRVSNERDDREIDSEPKTCNLPTAIKDRQFLVQKEVVTRDEEQVIKQKKFVQLNIDCRQKVKSELYSKTHGQPGKLLNSFQDFKINKLKQMQQKRQKNSKEKENKKVQSRNFPCRSLRQLQFFKPHFCQVQSVHSNSNSNSNSVSFIELSRSRTIPISKNCLGVYQYIQKGAYVGVGRFSSAYICALKELNFLFIMKEIFKFTISMNKLQDQFLREVVIQSSISHSNVISLYFMYQDNNKYYMALEYGQTTLLKILEEKQTIPQEQCIQYLREIIQGLKHLHQNEIIHRDIKPENVILVNGICKIADFGWSVKIAQLKNSICGTPCYASPQILGCQQYSFKTDCWSLGILAYQIRFGKLPFNDKKQVDLRLINETLNNESKPMHNEYVNFVKVLLAKKEEERLSIFEAVEHPVFSQAAL